MTSVAVFASVPIPLRSGTVTEPPKLWDQIGLIRRKELLLSERSFEKLKS